MVRMPLAKEPNTYELGTAIKITTVLNMDNPDSVKITIKDPTNLTVVDAATMVQDNGNVYNYVYQSSVTGSDGIYKAIIDATFGAYTARTIDMFTLEDNDQ